jgi:hypothetical protein
MSAVNLVANLVTPDYSAIYIVQSSVLSETQKRDRTAFDGVVGLLVEEHTKHALPDLVGINITEVEDKEGYKASLRSDDPSSSESSGSSSVLETNGIQSRNFIPRASMSGSSGRATGYWPGQRPGQEQATPRTATRRFGQFMFLPEARLPDSTQKRCLEIPACPRFLRANDVSTTRHFVDKAQEKYKLAKRAVQPFGLIIHTGVVLVISLLSLIIVGCISRFKPGQSSFIQKFVTMGWLASGVAIGLSFGIFPSTQAGARRLARRLGLFSFGIL